MHLKAVSDNIEPQNVDHCIHITTPLLFESSAPSVVALANIANAG